MMRPMAKPAAQVLLDNLNAYIQENGFTQSELARRARFPQTTLNRMFRALENGGSPTIATLDRLARALKIPLPALLTDASGSRTPPSRELPHLPARQLGRLIEDFLLSTEEGRREILRLADACALGQTSDPSEN